MTNLRSVCLQWISRLFEKGERATERTNQTSGSFDTASQMSGNNYLGPNAAIWQRDHGVCHQFKNNYASLEALCGNALKKNEWGSTVAGDLNRLGGSGHRSILLLVDANGEAYDFDGNKWSRVR